MNLESGEELSQDATARGRARARDEGNAQREHAGAVRLHQALNGVGEDVEEHVDKVVLRGNAAEEHGHKEQHACQAYESSHGAAGGRRTVDAGKLNLGGQVQRHHAEHKDDAPGHNVPGDVFFDEAEK